MNQYTAQHYFVSSWRIAVFVAAEVKTWEWQEVLEPMEKEFWLVLLKFEKIL